MSLLLTVLLLQAGPTCPDSYPLECSRLCIMLRRSVVGDTIEARDWLIGDYFYEDTGCDADARTWHNADDCTYARAWIDYWDHFGSCFHFPQECIRRRVECMRTHPQWDTCFGS
jgi:hypothetical protein